MTETKFTHGPWLIADMSDEEWDTFVGRQEFGKSEMIWNGTKQIADVCSWDGEVSESEYEANANLIAAAPDLYEALEAIRQINWMDGLKGLDGPTSFAERQSAIEAVHKAKTIARAALAKARGEG